MTGRALALGVAALLGGCGLTGGPGEIDPSNLVGPGSPLRVGVVAPLEEPYGADVLAGARLAATAPDPPGSQTAAPVEVVPCDTGGTVDGATRCVEQLADEGVRALVGATTGGATSAVLDAVDEAGVVYVATGTVDISDAGGAGDTVFRVGPLRPDRLALDTCLTYATEVAPAVGGTQVAMLVGAGSDAASVAEAVADCLPAPQRATDGAVPLPPTGLEVVAVEQRAAPADLAEQLARLGETGVRLVVDVGDAAGATAVGGAWAALEPEFALGRVWVEQERGVSVPPDPVPFALDSPAPLHPLPGDDAPERVDSFVEAWRAETDRPASVDAASAFDAVRMLAEAAQRASTSQPATLANDLVTTERVGVLGPEEFDADGELVFGGGVPEVGLAARYVQGRADDGSVLVFPDVVQGSEPYVLPPQLDVADD